MEDDPPEPPESLLPYGTWTSEALREVVARAVEHVAREGLPGEHHFYITFRTDHPQAVLPDRLRAQYPQEMTIVLQHQFHGLGFDRARGVIEVGLSFGGVPAKLVIPLGAVTQFADPAIRFMLQFEPEAGAETETGEAPPPPLSAPAEEKPADTTSQVVSLDAFRRRGPARGTPPTKAPDQDEDTPA